MRATTKQIHKRLYDMAQIVISILEKHNIPYSLAYGTLLGAVRHKGFIPWDEDFDLWLFDETYEQALKYLREELPDNMFVEDSTSEPKYFHAWAHVKDKNSVVKHNKFSQDDSYSHHGLYIDLYRLWEMKECDVETFLNEENRRYIMRRRELSLMNDEEFFYRMKILECNEKKALESIKKSKNEVYALLNVYKCKSIKTEYVFPLKKCKFEDSEFYLMNQAEKILKDIYGDWQTPLPADEREKIIESVILL